MTKKEVINEFVDDVTNTIKEEIVENKGQFDPSIFFLITDEEGNCEYIRKDLPPSPVDSFMEPSFDGLMKVFLHKMIFDHYIKEINNNKKSILHFIQSERINFEDKSVLSIVTKKVSTKKSEVVNKFYEIIEKDVIVTSDGDIQPSSIELVELED